MDILYLIVAVALCIPGELRKTPEGGWKMIPLWIVIAKELGFVKSQQS